MQHKAVDDAFMNFAYVSEEWLVKFLEKRKSHFPNTWTDERESQLQDEIRHSKMILEVLEKQNAIIFHDLAYSIQESVYHGAGLLDMSKAFENNEAFIVVQAIIERRATILYKIYLRVGKNDAYKKLIRQILDDESKHLKLASRELKRNLVFEYCEKVDRFLFRRISEKYGNFGDTRSSVVNMGFWEDLFMGRSVI